MSFDIIVLYLWKFINKLKMYLRISHPLNNDKILCKSDHIAESFTIIYLHEHTGENTPISF